MNTYGQYKLEFRVWNGSAYIWRDYTSYLISFDPISIKMETGAMPNSFTASMSSIVVNNKDGFWSGAMDGYLINSGEAYGKEFRKRRLRISEITTDLITENTRYLFTGVVDDLTYDNNSGKAKISVISLDRIAMEQRCDGEKINDTEIGGAWGTGKLYEDRDKNDNNGNFTYTWFNDRRYMDMLQRTCEALGDADYDIDIIEQATAGGRRVCTSREKMAGASGETYGYQLFWSPLHEELLVPYHSSAGYLKLYSYNLDTGVMTLRHTSASCATSSFAYWYNTESQKVFFITRYSIGLTYKLCQLNSDWTVNTQDISDTGFEGNACYCQGRDSGNGTILLAGGTSNNIYERECNDISSSYSLLGTGVMGVNIKKMVVDNGENRIAFVSAPTTTEDDIYFADITYDHSAWTTELYQLFDSPTNIAIDTMQFTEAAGLLVVKYNCYDRISYKVSYFTTLGELLTPTDLYTATESDRALGGFIKTADGYYFYEHSLYMDSTARPPRPTYLLSVKDADYTKAVYENLIDPSATYGESLVDGEIGISRQTTKYFNKNVIYYLGSAYKPGTDWAIYGITYSGTMMYQHALTLSPYCRMYDLAGLSVWQFRKLLAERFGAIMFYGGDGTFYFKNRSNVGSVSHALSGGVISLKSSGYKDVKNAVKSIPYSLPYGHMPDIDIKPWGITCPTSTVGLSAIKIGGYTTNVSRWRILFTSTTAFSLQEETSVGSWTARATGAVGTDFLYSTSTAQYTIKGGDWTGTAVIGDEFQFWSHKSQKTLKKLSEVERIEAEDLTSIAAYQRAEMSFDNRFTSKVCLLDIVTAILGYWKDPKRHLAVNHKRDADYKIWDVATIEDDFLGYTTGDEWSISGLKIKQGSPEIEIELTEA